MQVRLEYMGSHPVFDANCIEIPTKLVDKSTGEPLRFRPESETLRNYVMKIEHDKNSTDLFRSRNIEFKNHHATGMHSSLPNVSS